MILRPTRFLRSLRLSLPFLALSTAGCVVIPVADLLRGPPLEEQVLKDGAGFFSKEKIALIELSGTIQDSRTSGLLLSSENTVSELKARLERAADDPEVKAVVLRISSPGGEVTACDVLHQEVQRFRKEKGVPVVACITDQGTSGAYYIATAADRIIAHPTAIVGSIGVILQSFDLSGLLDRIGVDVAPVKSGDMKDLNSFFRGKSAAERAVLQKLVDDMHARFVDVVADGRVELSREEVVALADGRVLSGGEAAQAKLVDAVGYVKDAVDFAGERAGVDDPTIVRYARSGASGANIYTQLASGRPAAGELRLTWDGAPAARPGLYYLWSPGP